MSGERLCWAGLATWSCGEELPVAFLQMRSHLGGTISAPEAQNSISQNETIVRVGKVGDATRQPVRVDQFYDTKRRGVRNYMRRDYFFEIAISSGCRQAGVVPLT